MPNNSDNQSKGYVTFETFRYHDDEYSVSDDHVVEEQAVALEYNGIAHAVMMATPIHLYDFAMGFSLSEGIIRSKDDIFDSDISQKAGGISVALTIANSQFNQLKNRRRTLAGTAGCGLCGTESIEQALKPVIILDNRLSIDKCAIDFAWQTFSDAQTLQAITGGIHGAAWCNVDGVIAYLREDIGRHNALDKLIGCMADNNVDTKEGFAMVSSRLSYEMVQKANMAGIACLVAISAPSSLAINTAKQANMTIIGFVRQNQCVIYSHPSTVNG